MGTTRGHALRVNCEGLRDESGLRRLARLVRDLDSLDVRWALIGGLAVSTRAEPRYLLQGRNETSQFCNKDTNPCRYTYRLIAPRNVTRHVRRPIVVLGDDQSASQPHWRYEIARRKPVRLGSRFLDCRDLQKSDFETLSS